MDSASITLLAGIVFLASFSQTLSGFGYAVIVVTLGAFVRPVTELVPLIVPLVTVLSAWIAWRDRRQIQARLLLLGILPALVVGTFAGQYVFRTLAGPWMERLFGGIVVALALSELVRRSPPADRGSLPRPVVAGALLTSGVMQGLYAAGGPPLAYALARSDLTKGQLRATVSALWAILDLGMTAGFLADGRLSAAQLPELGVFAAATALAVPGAEWAHKRISAERFRTVLFVFLLVSGAVLAA